MKNHVLALLLRSSYGITHFDSEESRNNWEESHQTVSDALAQRIDMYPNLQYNPADQTVDPPSQEKWFEWINASTLNEPDIYFLNTNQDMNLKDVNTDNFWMKNDKLNRRGSALNRSYNKLEHQTLN